MRVKGVPHEIPRALAHAKGYERCGPPGDTQRPPEAVSFFIIPTRDPPLSGRKGFTPRPRRLSRVTLFSKGLTGALAPLCTLFISAAPALPRPRGRRTWAVYRQYAALNALREGL